MRNSSGLDGDRVTSTSSRRMQGRIQGPGWGGYSPSPSPRKQDSLLAPISGHFRLPKTRPIGGDQQEENTQREDEHGKQWNENECGSQA
nr:unnamed protein product [Digitaria exilis]